MTNANDRAAREAEKAVQKKHKFVPMAQHVHTSFVYQGAGSWGPGCCATCGQPPNALCHTMDPSATAPTATGNPPSGGTTAVASRDLYDWASKICSCGRAFATEDGFQRHAVSRHATES